MGWTVYSHKAVPGAANGTEELFSYDVSGSSEDVAEVTWTLEQHGHKIQAVLPPDEEAEPDTRSRRRR